MAVSNPYSQYQSTQLSTAGPDKLLLMAYDGAIRFAKIGREKIKTGARGEQSVNISKAQAIIAELMMTLNPEPNPQLVANLANLYDYMFNRLGEANVNNDEATAGEVIEILMDLREAWAQAAHVWRGQSAQEDLAA